MEWISIKNKLPQLDMEVLTYTDKYEKYQICKYRKFRHGSYFMCGPYVMHDVTHWIPLPKPPEK